MKQTDDIDLIDLVLTLWRSKWIIFSSIFILISAGLIFKIFKNDTNIKYEAIYQSELNYSVNLPFYNFDKAHYLHIMEKLLNEFEEMIYVEGNFSDEVRISLSFNTFVKGGLNNTTNRLELK